MLVRTFMAGSAFGYIINAFFIVLLQHAAFRVLMATIAGIGSQDIIGMTGIAAYIMVFIEPEISRVFKRGRDPFAGGMAFLAIVGNGLVVIVNRRLVTGLAFVPDSRPDHVMVKRSPVFPVIGIVAIAACCGKLIVQGVGRWPVTTAAVIQYAAC